MLHLSHTSSAVISCHIACTANINIYLNLLLILSISSRDAPLPIIDLCSVACLNAPIMALSIHTSLPLFLMFLYYAPIAYHIPNITIVLVAHHACPLINILLPIFLILDITMNMPSHENACM